MRRKSVLILLLVVVLVSLQYPRFQQNIVDASDGFSVHNLNTGLNYTTIQEAIDANETLDGHTIMVDAGTFNEGILLNKAISLFGENRTNTVIDGYGVRWAVQITTCNATISGFTIKNGGNGMSTRFLPDGGIRLVSNYSTISDNVIVDNDYSGIWSDEYAISNGITIEGNFVGGNFYGIALSHGSTSNNLTKNIVTGNTWVGIQVSGEDNILRQNIIDNNTCGFSAFGVHDIDESNLVDGKPIIYWINEHDRTVPSNAGYIAAINCVNISVIDVSLKNLLAGIVFRNTSSSTIRNAIVLNCSGNNVLLSNSHGNILTNCTLMSNSGPYSIILALGESSNNTVSDTVIEGGNVIMPGKPYRTGISLYDCSYNLITRNTLINNSEAIFLEYANNNTIYHNNFINNPDPVGFPIPPIIQNNTWDNGYPSGGNYWSNYNGTDSNLDGIGDTPYIIDANNTDHFPLMYPYGSIKNLNTSLTYLTIQQAIDANETLDGHVIHVETGIYDMIYTRINKSVSLLGEGMENTTIIGLSDFYQIPIFDVFSDNVTISGFTLTGGYTAVDILASYTHVTNCNISDNIHGIYAGRFYELFGAVTIDGNIIANNNVSGINLSTWSNVISNNLIFGNSEGIMLSSTGSFTNSTQVFGNTIENSEIGILFGGSNDNTLFHNNFVNNTVQVQVWSFPPHVGNDWAENYWSDYNGTGDTPYVIDANNQDPYPLMTPYVIPEFPSFLILPLFFLATLLAVLLHKRKRQKLSRATYVF
jgi:parallel beta-helix repeat protein